MGRKKKNKGKKGKIKSPEKKQEKPKPVADSNSRDGLLKRYNVRVGPVGYVPAPPTTPKNVSIDSFKMMDPGGGRTLLDPTDLKITQGMKYGLVGKNGYGKTTLLKQMAAYSIEGFPTHIRMLTVAQEQPYDDRPILEAVLNADEMRTQLEKEIERIGELFSSEDLAEEEMEPLSKVLDALYDMQGDINYDQGEREAQKILAGLGFSKEQVSSRVCDLSGGWRMRVALAKALFVAPDLLLLDEPTNHLDFPTVLWLQQYLQRYKKTVIIVSHDRTFLNQVVTHIIHIDKKQLTYYRGDYNAFETLRAQAFTTIKSAHDKGMVKIRAKKAFIEKFRDAGTKRLAQVQQAMKELVKLEEECPEEPKAEKLLSFAFPEIGLLGDHICVMNDITFGYTKEKLLLKNISLALDETDKIGMIGANGVGKTTLVKLIMGALEPLDGEVTRNRSARIALFTQHHIDQLDLNLSAVEFILKTFADDEDLQNDKDRVQTVRRRLGRFHITGQQQTQKMGLLSGGQKSRVAFAVCTWRKPHFLIMDEPTNHLDVETINSLIDAVKGFEGGVLLISHDQHFLKEAAHEYWAVTSEKICRFEYFEEAKHFSLKRLLPNTERPGKKKKKKPAAKPVAEPVEVKPKPESEPEPELEDNFVIIPEGAEETNLDDLVDEDEPSPETEKTKRRRRKPKDDEEDEDEKPDEEEKPKRRRRAPKEETVEEEEKEEPKRRRRKKEETVEEEEEEPKRRRRKKEEEEEVEEPEEKPKRRRRKANEEEEEEKLEDKPKRRRRKKEVAEEVEEQNTEEEDEEEEEEKPKRRRRKKEETNETEEVTEKRRRRKR